MENNGTQVELERKVQAVKVEKIGGLFADLGENVVKSIVAFKSGNDPLIHLLSVPSCRMDKVLEALRLLDIKTDFVEVVQDDFGDLEPVQKA